MFARGTENKSLSNKTHGLSNGTESQGICMGLPFSKALSHVFISSMATSLQPAIEELFYLNYACVM